MNQLLAALPGYYDAIVEDLARADWLVHNFRKPNPEGLYNPANYLHNREFDETEYRALIDLNVLQFIVNCLKKGKPHQNYRTACALLVFCRLSDIQIEPALAVYERINYNAENLEEALTEVQLLRSLDNADVDYLAQYALGVVDNLLDIDRVHVERESLAAGLTQYRRLTHWDSVYLLVLGAISVYWDAHIPQNRKLENYVEWMLREYRLSLPCVVYAVRLFGQNPMPKMMKFRPDRPEHLRRIAVFNMTWDLFHVDHYFKIWTNPQEKWEALFFTHDRVLKSVMRLAISVQYAGTLDPVLQYLSERQAAALRSLIDTRSERTDRVYGTDAWTPEHRSRGIAAIEAALFQ
ncbi:MAG: hypothetical protein HY067_07805 [Betaproteobacteria bacterium]|nr:hypothetical protein [Betaproteobacteria bacterium]